MDIDNLSASLRRVQAEDHYVLNRSQAAADRFRGELVRQLIAGEVEEAVARSYLRTLENYPVVKP